MAANAPTSPVHVFHDLETLSRAAAQHLAAHIEATLDEHDRYALALAGGSTPRRCYELLAHDYGDALPWSRIHLFWGDERFVPHDHAASNVRMVHESLLQHLDVPAANVHPIPTTDHPDPEAAAAAYADLLHRHFDDRAVTFDCVLLGLGADGHTASLFPEHDPSPDDPRWVRAVEAPPRYDVRSRLTCTLPVLNASDRVVFLVSGAEKREALRAVLEQSDASLPAARVRPESRPTWFVDEAAHASEARPQTESK